MKIEYIGGIIDIDPRDVTGFRVLFEKSFHQGLLSQQPEHPFRLVVVVRQADLYNLMSYRTFEEALAGMDTVEDYLFPADGEPVLKLN